MQNFITSFPSLSVVLNFKGLSSEIDDGFEEGMALGIADGIRLVEVGIKDGNALGADDGLVLGR